MERYDVVAIEADDDRARSYARRHRDSTVVITGGASGIGWACAVRLVAEGARVAIGDIDQGSAERAASRLGADHAIGMGVDVRVPEDCRRLAAATISTFGGVTGLIAAAGISGPKKPISDFSDDEWSLVLDVNLNGTLHSVRAVVPHLQPGASLVTLCSGNGSVARAQNGAYCVSKAAVWMLTKVLALELGPRGVRVNSVAPGVIETPMMTEMLADKAHRDRMIRATPLGRLGRPEDVASVATYLLSTDSDFVCGELLSVDGGLATPARV